MRIAAWHNCGFRPPVFCLALLLHEIGFAASRANEPGSSGKQGTRISTTKWTAMSVFVDTSEILFSDTSRHSFWKSVV